MTTAKGLSCETCGTLDADVRLLVFVGGSRRVYCSFHRRIERAAAWALDSPLAQDAPVRPGTAFEEPAKENAELLLAIATELRRRGSKDEALRAEAAAAKLARIR